MRHQVLSATALVWMVACGSDRPSEKVTDFPPMGPISADSGRGSFRFGAASAATQIEDQNVSTDWYFFTEPPPAGLGMHTFVGDAAMGYTNAVSDVALATALHLDSYRFSIEWARVEPRRDAISEPALQHYGSVIDALIAANVRPNVTVHHFSNPVWIADPGDNACAAGPTDTNLCGLGHPQGGPLVIGEMAEHARLLAERFGDRVDDWATFNEPVNYLLAAYGIGVFPPGKALLFSGTDLSDFLPVVKDALAAHAAMYAAIKEADTVDADGDGIAANVGMTLSVVNWTPARDNATSTDPEDIAARDRLEYVFHFVAPDSLTAGTWDSNLDGTPDEQHPEWVGLDWLGLQYYFRAGVTGKQPTVIPLLNLTPCFSGVDGGACLPAKDPTTCVPAMAYEFDAPGFYDVMRSVSNRYPDLPLMVSESGIATEVGARRAENVVRVLEQIQRVRSDGGDVRGYYHWSLYDNFEWNSGFGPRFGLYTVDYTTYARTATTGADVLAAIAGSRTITDEQHATYGGTGPMTPETGATVNALCR